jgi:uncharacterized protein
MTASEIIVQKLRILKPELISRFYVRSIGLFGSVVRDDFSFSNSDIDIIVDFSRPVGVEFIDLAEFLEKKIERKVDLVSQKGIKPKYFDKIRQEIIYV